MRTVPLTHQRVTIQDDFDLDKILESGQCFRPRKLADGRCRFVSGKALLYLTPLGCGQYDAAWYGADWDVWAGYFDLGRSYAALRQSLAGQSAYLDAALAFGQGIRVLRSHGIDLSEIEKAIQRTANISRKELDKLLDEVVERNQRYYTDLIDLAGVTKPETMVSVEDTWAIYEQTRQELRNLTRSIGFLVDNGRTMLKPAKAYQWALDNAEMQVMSGAVSYNQAIRNTVKQLADSGIKIVAYEGGHRDQIDVAARRAVMTGVSQLCAKYTEQSAEYLETPYFEVSAHVGARDQGAGWQNHKAWQGRVYSVRTGDKYPSIYEVCGLGYVDGLEGANCRHIRTAFVDGVMERTYTDKELEHIDDGHDVEFEGKRTPRFLYLGQ